MLQDTLVLSTRYIYMYMFKCEKFKCSSKIPNNIFWALALERKWAHMEKEKSSLTSVGFEPTTSGTDHRCSTNWDTRPDGSWSWEIEMVICSNWTRKWRGTGKAWPLSTIKHIYIYIQSNKLNVFCIAIKLGRWALLSIKLHWWDLKGRNRTVCRLSLFRSISDWYSGNCSVMLSTLWFENAHIISVVS